MTQEQYRHWKNFSMRMAWRGYEIPRRSRKRLAEFVKEFFRIYLENDWLQGNDKPVPDGDWGKQYEFLLSRIRSWDHTDSHPTWTDQYGHRSNGPYVCDIVDESMEHWNPHYWARGNAAYDRWDRLWGTRIRSCLRAGIDMASEPSMGVMGFTAGDLRRMYRGNVPAWIMGEERLEVQHWKGVVPGVGLVPGKRTRGKKFKNLRDDVQVWL